MQQARLCPFPFLSTTILTLKISYFVMSRCLGYGWAIKAFRHDIMAMAVWVLLTPSAGAVHFSELLAYYHQ